MGTDFDSMNECSATSYYENGKSSDEEVHNNRRILYNSMIMQGFTNYEEEWWHYDFVNQMWVMRKNMSTAFYGDVLNVKDTN